MSSLRGLAVTFVALVSSSAGAADPADGPRSQAPTRSLQTSWRPAEPIPELDAALALHAQNPLAAVCTTPGQRVINGSADGKRGTVVSYNRPSCEECLNEYDCWLYRGDLENGVPHGRGFIVWDDKLYAGEVRGGRAEGRGAKLWASGARYIGGWRAGKKHGVGVYTWPGGAEYDGEWHDDQMQGRGREHWPNGDAYEGQWRAGRRDGSGTMRYADGRTYTGQWRADRPHGVGAMKHPDGRLDEGVFEAGAFVPGGLGRSPGVP